MPIIDKIQLSGTVYTIGSENSGVTSGEVQTMIDNSLSGYVTTNTKQEITGNKTFIGSLSTSEKPIILKQVNDNHKIGFVCRNSAEINNEIATFEFRPDTYTDSSSVKHPLLYLGHYRNNGTANAGVPQTMVGFRQYDQKGGAAYHYLIPLPAEAKTPFRLNTSFKNYFAPLGFKVDSGGTMVTTDNTGVVDLSSYLGGGGSITVDQTIDRTSENPISNKAISNKATDGNGDVSITGGRYQWAFYSVGGVGTNKGFWLDKINGEPVIRKYNNTRDLSFVETSAITTSVTSSSTDAQVPSAKAVNDKLGGLSLVKLTQAEYDALATKDSNVLYVIVG